MKNFRFQPWAFTVGWLICNAVTASIIELNEILWLQQGFNPLLYVGIWTLVWFGLFFLYKTKIGE